MVEVWRTGINTTTEIYVVWEPEHLISELSGENNDIVNFKQNIANLEYINLLKHVAAIRNWQMKTIEYHFGHPKTHK